MRISDWSSDVCSSDLVTLAARDGTFTAKGTTQASRLFGGSTASLLGPQTDLDLTARLAERKADLDGRVSSDAFRLGISGGLDLGRNRSDGLQLAFVLRSEEHTSELPSLIRISYAVICFNKQHYITAYDF